MKKIVGLILVIGMLLSGAAFADRNISLGPFSSDGWAVISEEPEPYKTVLLGYVDTTGRFLQGEWEYGMAFSEGLAAVMKDGKYGFIDTMGELVIPYEWENVKFFREGLAGVCKDDKWGFVDKAGNLVIPYQWDYCSYGFNEGLAVVSNKGEGQYYVLDKEGNAVLTVAADAMSSYFSEGLAEIQRNGKYGYIDQAGELVIPCTWDSTNSFHDGLAKVKLGDTYFCINKKGEQLNFYDELRDCENSWDFSDDLCRIKKNGLQGYIDRRGDLVIPCEWMSATNFVDGIACVKKGALWGAIDQSGELVVPCKYRDVTYGNGHFALLDNDVITILDSDMNETGKLSFAN